MLLLREAYAENPEKFFQEFLTPLHRVLLVYKREPAVERLVEFVSQFAEAAPNWGETFALDLLRCEISFDFE